MELFISFPIIFVFNPPHYQLTKTVLSFPAWTLHLIFLFNIFILIVPIAYLEYIANHIRNITFLSCFSYFHTLIGLYTPVFNEVAKVLCWHIFYLLMTTGLINWRFAIACACFCHWGWSSKGVDYWRGHTHNFNIICFMSHLKTLNIKLNYLCQSLTIIIKSPCWQILTSFEYYNRKISNELQKITIKIKIAEETMLWPCSCRNCGKYQFLVLQFASSSAWTPLYVYPWIRCCYSCYISHYCWEQF